MSSRRSKELSASQSITSATAYDLANLRIAETKGPSTSSSKSSAKPAQASAPSQETMEGTQQDTQIVGDDFDAISELVHMESIPPPPPRPWARLITKGNDSVTYELVNIEVDKEGRYNLVALGRASTCNIRFHTSPRVSNKHCMLYCKMNQVDKNHPYLEAWIEDTSANGTFLNHNIKLKKNVPRLLRTGDEVSLVNPELVRLAAAAVSEDDVLRNTFTVILDLPKPEIGTAGTGNMALSLRSATAAISKSHQELGRSSTVIRLLNQQRSIYEHYELRELLGTGAAGQVYRGIKKDTGHDYAVKIIDIRQLDGSNFTGQNGGEIQSNAVTKEAEMLRSIRHPNIIHLEDIFSEGNNLFLVMELSSGGDLFERISKKKKYNEIETKEVMKQLLEAMAFIHSKKIAHRDLKPENILLPYKDNDTFIKVTDFGLAKQVDEKEGLKSYCGTPQYFAPEVMERKNTMYGQGRYNVEADMWSCGCIMYVLLAGSFPFHGNNDKLLFGAIRNAKYNIKTGIWTTVSQEAKDLLSKLLMVNPQERLSAEQALQHVWFHPAESTSSNSASSSRHNTAGNTMMMSQDDLLMPPPAPPANKKAVAAPPYAAAPQAAAVPAPAPLQTTWSNGETTTESGSSDNTNNGNGKATQKKSMTGKRKRSEQAATTATSNGNGEEATNGSNGKEADVNVTKSTRANRRL